MYSSSFKSHYSLALHFETILIPFVFDKLTLEQYFEIYRKIVKSYSYTLYLISLLLTSYISIVHFLQLMN